jgi:hypothetical protein
MACESEDLPTDIMKPLRRKGKFLVSIGHWSEDSINSSWCVTILKNKHHEKKINALAGCTISLRSVVL